MNMKVIARFSDLQSQPCSVPQSEKKSQAISFGYASARIENPNVTRQMATDAYDRAISRAGALVSQLQDVMSHES